MGIQGFPEHLLPGIATLDKNESHVILSSQSSSFLGGHVSLRALAYFLQSEYCMISTISPKLSISFRGPQVFMRNVSVDIRAAQL